MLISYRAPTLWSLCVRGAGVVSVGSAIVSGCGTSDSNASKKGFLEICSTGDQCASGRCLTWTDQLGSATYVCSQTCDSAGSCPAGTVCSTTASGEQVCTIPCSQGEQLSFACVDGTRVNCNQTNGEYCDTCGCRERGASCDKLASPPRCVANGSNDGGTTTDAGPPVNLVPTDDSVLAVGFRHACVLNDAGSIACWGDNTYGQATPPSGTFTQICAGLNHSCGLRKADNQLACWGLNDMGESTPPAGNFLAVNCGYSFTCGITTDNALVCWGKLIGSATALSMPPGPGTVHAASASAGGAGVCAIDTNLQLHCWNDLPGSDLTGSFRAISVGSNTTCAIGANDGKAKCWYRYGIGDLPAQGLFSGFLSVSAGEDYACGIQASHLLVCDSQGDESDPTLIVSPQMEAAAVATGPYFACALGLDGTIACWGRGVPAGTPANRNALPDGGPPP